MGLADLHIHTSYSWDSNLGVEEMLAGAAGAGLDVVAVTDHNTISGALAAHQAAAQLDLGVQVVVGEELDTLQGHLIGLFLTEQVPPRLSLEKTIDLIHEQHGLVVVPHPGGPVPWHLRPRRVLEIRDKVDAIEVYNANWSAVAGRRGARHRNRSTYRLAVTGGSDAHVASAIGYCVTTFEGNTAMDLRAALEAGKTSASGRPLPFTKGMYSLGSRAREGLGRARFVETAHYASWTAWARASAEAASGNE